MAELKIMSVNCQGLNDINKRLDVLSFLKNKDYNIYCLQDTHFTKNIEKCIHNQWGNDCLFSSYNSNSRGVAILFNTNFDYKILRHQNDNNGNLLAVEIECESNIITLVSIYGPNTDSPEFYKTVEQAIDYFNSDHYIVCGDFNLIMSESLDCMNYLTVNNPKARQRVVEMIEDKYLIDTFRELHPNLKRYTWRKNRPFKQSRLDYIFISETLLPYLANSSIEPSYRSDHSATCVILKMNNFTRYKGLWKFNNSLLNDMHYLDIVNSTIEDTIKEYAALVYDHNNLNNMNKSDIHFTINDQLFLDALLMKIRGKTISFASYKRKNSDRIEKQLIQEISEIEKSFNESKIDSLEQKRDELNSIRNNKLQGSMIRSRAQWIADGEKPTKFFCSLETHNFINKTIYKLETDNGNIISDQQLILDEIENFYKKLYSENESTYKNYDISEFLDHVQAPSLSDKESNDIEGLVTYNEAYETLQKMKSNKSPGSDGFTTEFFKCFWSKLGYFIVRSINYGYMVGELSSTQKHGIITCLPKGDKPKQFLKNWRPLTLLNTVYKIASGIISNRIKKVLHKIISEDQTGFIAGRYIGENTRLIYDIMHYTEQQQIPGLLLLIDFEKAFDTISWKFIHKCFKFFNFGDSIIQWIKLFQNKIYSNICQCGKLSKNIYIQRGCRQGDPVAAQIFIICAEILSLKIKNDNEIKGIKIGQKEIKLSQFADDTTIILNGTEKSFSYALSDLSKYGEISGLNMNLSKTQVIWIGSKKYSSDKLCRKYNLKWGITRFNLLGIDFDVNLHDIPKLNFDKKIVKLKALIKTWKRRKLTPLGRITVFKTLLITQLNHLFITLPTTDKYLKDINMLMYNFIWEDKPDKIKREISCLDYKLGGLKIPDLFSYNKSLKSTWIRRYLHGIGKWKLITDHELNMSHLMTFGLDYMDKAKQRCTNRFWIEVLTSWQSVIVEELQSKVFTPLQLPIWYNNMIKIGNKSIFYKDWYNHGIRYIRDLVDIENKFYDIKDFQNQYNIKTNFITYYGLIKAIKTTFDLHHISDAEILQYPLIPLNIKIFFNCKKGSKDIYKILCYNKIKQQLTPISALRWNRTFDFDKQQWKLIYNLPFTTTTDTRLRWFQVRINHRILGTNWLLNKIDNTDKLCYFCKTHTETIEHLFWECQTVKTFINNFQESVQQILNNDNIINFTASKFIFVIIFKTVMLQKTLLFYC